jgi:hypothetical protein
MTVCLRKMTNSDAQHEESTTQFETTKQELNTVTELNRNFTRTMKLLEDDRDESQWMQHKHACNLRRKWTGEKSDLTWQIWPSHDYILGTVIGLYPSR